MKRIPEYTIVRRDPRDVKEIGGGPLRLQRRSPRDRGKRVVLSGTLREVVDYLREHHSDQVQDMIDEAVRIQTGMPLVLER